MLKKLLLLAVFIISLCGIAQAQEFTFKQGMLYLYDDNQVKNFSCLEIVKTKAGENWPKWVNMVWDGWTVDGGINYDLAGINSVALVLGRSFGKLGQYLPLEYPLLNKIDITVYPIGVAVKEPFDGPEAQLASGFSMLKLGVKF